MMEGSGVCVDVVPSRHTYLPIRNARVLDTTSPKAFGLAPRHFQAASETLGAARTEAADTASTTSVRQSMGRWQGSGQEPAIAPTGRCPDVVKPLRNRDMREDNG